MTITTNPSRDEYTSGPGQTVFNYTFKIYANDELDVYVTPAGQQANDATDLTTDYVVDPVTIGDEGGGFITFNTPLNNGDAVTIVSGMDYDRTVDYQVNGDFIPSTVNTDNDRQVSQIKQVLELARKAVVFGQAQQSTSGLTSEAPEAGKFIRWKEDLSGFENSDLNDLGSIPTSSIDIIYPTVALMKADSLSVLNVGVTVSTQGYYASGDGGGGTYLIAASQAVDEFGDHTLASGNVALLQSIDNTVSGLQYGAVGDGVADDTAALQAALNSDNQIINLPVSEYLISSSLEMHKGQTLQGSGRYYKLDFTGNTAVITSDQSGGAYPAISVEGNVARGFALRNLVIQQSTANATRAGQGLRVGTFSSGGSAATGHNCLVENVMFFYFDKGIWFDGRAYDARFVDCLFKTQYTNGVHVNSGTNINACVFENLSFEDTGASTGDFADGTGDGDGFCIESGTASTLINPRFNPVLGTGLMMTVSGVWSCYGGYFENCGVADIVMNDDTTLSIDGLQILKGGSGTYSGTLLGAIVIRGDARFYGKGIRYTSNGSTAVDASGRSPALFAQEGLNSYCVADGVEVPRVYQILGSGGSPQGRPLFYSPGSGTYRVPDFIRTIVDGVPFKVIPDSADARTHVVSLDSGLQPTDITFTDDNAADTIDYLTAGSLAPSRQTTWSGSSWQSIGQEEGLFDPTLTTSGTDFDSVTYDAFTKAKYYKVGNLVTVYGTVRTDAVTVGSASGAVAIGGLPFPVSDNDSAGTRDGISTGAVSDCTGWAVDTPFSCAANPNSSIIILNKRATVNGDDVIVAVSDVATGANANRVAFSCTYITD